MIEIFFGPKNKDRILSQFAIGAGGGRFATRGNSEYKNYEKWESAVTKENNCWILEVRIPFAELGWNNPESGDMIGFNICRQRKKANELITWVPLKNSFHEVENFGILVLNDYAKGLEKKYGRKESEVNRVAFERISAEEETKLLRAKYEKNAKRKFSVAVVPVTADYSIPFVPEEVFNPVESISLKAAVNEIKPLPLAIANLTDKIAEYRIILETNEKYNGKYGLNGFPENKIISRKAVRFKDDDKNVGSLRLDPLPKMDEAFTITIPPKEAGVVWFDFDTTDVKPGKYEGRIRIIPLSEAASWESINGSFWNRKYTGEMADIPLSLTVRNIVLSKNAAIPTGFFQDATNQNMFNMMKEVGTENFGISPWSFNFNRDKNGSIIPDSYNGDHLVKLEKTISQIKQWCLKSNITPKFFIGFSSYRAFQSVYGTKNKPGLNEKLWGEWIAAVKLFMNKNGISDSDYEIETWDEPDPKLFPELITTHTIAKKAAPEAKLLITLGAHIMAATDMEKLSPYTDAWVLWRYGYFSRPEHIRFIEKTLKEGKKIGHYSCDTSMRANLDRNFRKHAWHGEKHGLTGNYFYWFSDSMGGYGASDFKIATQGGISYHSFDNFMPSIRYMAMRQGVMDIKYLAKVKELGKKYPEAEKFYKHAIQRVMEDFNHDKSMSDKVVEEAAELILKLEKK